jgi:phenylpyruvate tautomerase PptA (4-oxalocrotonate tautomerase family)
MPMLDITIPEGAISQEAEQALMARLTDLLLEGEGVDHTNPLARSLAWVFLHRPAQMFVAGLPAELPRYRVVASVPEGKFDDENRNLMVSTITDAVLDAEEGSHPRDPMRVWVFTREIPEGTWGGNGRIIRLAEIVGFVRNNIEEGRRYAEKIFAKRRQIAS